MHDTLRKLGLTSKKKTLHAAEQERPDVAAARTAWRESQARLRPGRLIFLDETSVKTNMLRTHGRAPIGERWRALGSIADAITTQQNVPTISAIAAIPSQPENALTRSQTGPPEWARHGRVTADPAGRIATDVGAANEDCHFCRVYAAGRFG